MEFISTKEITWWKTLDHSTKVKLTKLYYPKKFSYDALDFKEIRNLFIKYRDRF